MSTPSLHKLVQPWDAPTAVISEDGLYRYELTRRWERGGATMTFVMLNPSTADALTDDPTVRRCVGFAKREGCAALRVLNLYAFRTPSPRELRAARRRHVDVVGPENDNYLRTVTTMAGPVVAAWGPSGEPDRVAEVVEILTFGIDEVLHALHVTKGGAPGHPLYLAGGSPLVEWSP
jgi:hypothetical protein